MAGRGLVLAAAVILLVAAALAAIVLWEGSSGQPGTGTPAPSGQVVVDALGRRVTLPDRVERVVAVGPGSLRVVVYLNASSMVVGVEAVEKRWSPMGRPYLMAHPELRELPTIGPGGPGAQPDPEAIMRVRPDVILATFLTRREADVLQEKTGIPVVVLGSPLLVSVDDLRRYEETLLLAGRVLGRERRAEKLVEFIESVLRDLEERVRGASINASVYVGGIGFRGRRGITSTWCHYPLFQLLHVESVVDRAGCRGGHLEVSRETLLKWNPDIVFLDENGLLLVAQDYKRNPGFYRSLSAFHRGNVYGILPFNYYATNYELALADAYYIGKILYPDRFRDVDPAARADEIIEFFVGKPLYRELARFYGGFRRISLEDLAAGGVGSGGGGSSSG